MMPMIPGGYRIPPDFQLTPDGVELAYLPPPQPAPLMQMQPALTTLPVVSFRIFLPAVTATLPTTPPIPPTVATGDVITSTHENTVTTSLDDLWVNEQWIAAHMLTDPTTTPGDIIVRDSSTPSALNRLPLGANASVLTADNSQFLGMKWAPPVAAVSSVFGRTGAVVAQAGDYSVSQISGALADPTTTKGDLLVRGVTVIARLAVGADGTSLLADSTQTLGVRWGAISTGSIGAVPVTRQVLAGAGMSGGGDLSLDRTLSANVVTVFGRIGNVVLTTNDITLAGGVAATRQVIAGTGMTGGGALTADVTLNAAVISVFGRTGPVVAQNNDYTVAQITGAVASTRQIIAGTGLAATPPGSDLSVDRTLNVVDDTTNQRVQVALAGGLVAARRQLNFIAGIDQAINVVDIPSANRVDITFTTTGGGGVPGPSLYAVNGAIIGTRTQLNLIAGTGLSLLGVDNSGANRVDVTFTATTAGVTSVFGRSGDVVAQTGDYLVDQVTGAVPTTRKLNAGVGLAGGGDLSADRSLTVINDTTNQRVQVASAGTVVGTRPEINFIQGANVTLTVADNTTSNRVDVTITAAAAPAAPVSSVFGRTGAVVAVSSDYSGFYVPLTRNVNTGAGLSGGGALSADLTLAGVVFKASGASHASGDVPDPGATAGSTRYLREDATWGVPPGSGASQTPWLSDIDGGGHNLSNVAKIVMVAGSPGTGGIQFPGGGLQQYAWTTCTDGYSINYGGGNVGIGTNQPQELLDVNGGIRVGAVATWGWHVDYFTNPNSVAMEVADDATRATFYSFSIDGNPLILNATSKANVGIGTASPGNKLHVYNAGNCQMLVQATSGFSQYLLQTDTRIWQLSSGGSTTGAYNGTVYLFDQTGNAVRLLIDTAGRIGIGTMPGIGGDFVDISNAGSTLGFYFDTTPRVYIGTRTAARLDFGYNGGLAMSITGNPAVGIGTANPQQALDVQGGNISVYGAGGYSIYAWSPGDVNWRFGMSDQNATVGFARNLLTAHVMYASFASSGGQGFAVGDKVAGLSSFEVGGSGNSYQAYHRGSVGIGLNPFSTVRLTVWGPGAAWPITSGASWGNIVARFGDTSNAILDIGGNGGAGFWLQVGDQTGGQYHYPLILNLNGGNVGIGRQPGYPLDVQGDARIVGNLRINSTYQCYFESYGIGWYAQDGTWIRSSGNAGVWLNSGNFGTNGGLTLGYSGAGPPAGGAIMSGKVSIGTSTLAPGNLTIYANGYGIRLAGPSYGMDSYIDASNFYFLLTNANDPYGGYNGLRPFYIVLSSGAVYMSQGVNVSGGMNVSGTLNLNGTNILNVGQTPWNSAINGNNQQLNNANAISIGTTNINEPLVVNGLGASGQCQIRLVYGNYGMQFRADGTNFYFLFTNSGDPYGNFNGVRSLSMSLNNGFVGLGQAPSGWQFQMSTDGAVKASTSTWGVASDSRLKRNLRPLEGGLEVIKRLPKIYEAEYNGLGGTIEGMRVVNFLAHEIRELLPGTVQSRRVSLRDGEEADINYLNLHEVLMHLILAVQQLAAKN
jgi:hypothetical protein